MLGHKTTAHQCRDYCHRSAWDFLLDIVTFVVGAESCLQNQYSFLKPWFSLQQKGVSESSTQLPPTAVLSLHGVSQILPFPLLCGFPGNSQILVYKHILRASKPTL